MEGSVVNMEQDTHSEKYTENVHTLNDTCMGSFTTRHRLSTRAQEDRISILWKALV